MTTTDPYAGFGTKITPQSQRVPGRPEQVKNNAGGYVFAVDPFTQLRRFLTIGTAGGTYYVAQNDLTRENGELIIALTTDVANHKLAAATILEISLAGRAPKQQPTLFALAILCQMGETEGKQYARSLITQVVRTGSHLFTFVKYLQQFGGWSSGLRKAVAKWYTEKDADQLAYQLVKYRQRDGFTHRDVLRLVHPKIEEPIKRAVIQWAVKGETKGEGPVPSIITGHIRAMRGNTAPEVLLESYKLPWEALPDSAMNSVPVWDKMLDNGIPINALMRQLPRLTQLGIVGQMGARTDDVVAQLLNPEAVAKSRIHPFQVLVALMTYKQGHGIRSQWTPVTNIIDALDEMYYMAFGNVEPTGKRTMNALDVSGSMGGYYGMAQRGIPLTPREISAAMAMVSVRTEPSQIAVGFTSGTERRGWAQRGDAVLTHLPISKRQRLDDVIRTISGLPFGGTDCSLPMRAAMADNLEIDTFVIYTDNETWAGPVQPFQALKQYRKQMGIDAKLVVVACSPTQFTIADPTDTGMLDISGFDSATPNLIADFSKGLV